MKKLMCVLLVLSLSMAWSVPAFAAASTNILSEKNVVSMISNIVSNGEEQTISLYDGIITQYSADNGDIVHITSFNDGRVRYEYYCYNTEKIYSFYSECLNENIGRESVGGQIGEMEFFDVAAYREANTERYELSDEDEKEIREIMRQEDSAELC